jgi:hypothetical protein
MDIKSQYLKAITTTRLLTKTQHDTMKVVNDFLNTQVSLCTANNIRFFVPAKTRTKADEYMVNEICANKKLKMKG